LGNKGLYAISADATAASWTLAQFGSDIGEASTNNYLRIVNADGKYVLSNSGNPHLAYTPAAPTINSSWTVTDDLGTIFTSGFNDMPMGTVN
jgi:hypothetical protein